MADSTETERPVVDFFPTDAQQAKIAALLESLPSTSCLLQGIATALRGMELHSDAQIVEEALYELIPHESERL